MTPAETGLQSPDVGWRPGSINAGPLPVPVSMSMSMKALSGGDYSDGGESSDSGQSRRVMGAIGVNGNRAPVATVAPQHAHVSALVEIKVSSLL